MEKILKKVEFMINFVFAYCLLIGSLVLPGKLLKTILMN